MNDALLVAWLDGEVTPDERAHVESAIAADDRVRAKVDVLRTARAELHELLAGPDGDLLPVPQRRTTLPWLAAAAALLVVVAIAVSRAGEHDVAAAANEWLELRLVPEQPAQPLFSDIRFQLVGRSKKATPCRIVAREAGETDAAVAARVLAEPAGRSSLPLVLDGEVTLPDGTVRRGAFSRVAGTFAAEAGSSTAIWFELVDLVAPHLGINPWLTVGITGSAATEDFLAGITRAGSPELGGEHGFVPEEPGTYRLKVSLRSFTAAGDPRFATFAEPLVVETTFEVTGIVGVWSAPQDGLSARIVATSALVNARWKFALQLRNDSDRPRAYNVAGSTLAKIPQPFHFDLLVDGERWQQRDRLPVTFLSGSEFLPQPVKSMRSVVVLDSFWRRDGKALADLRGKHTLALRFHFEPTVWSGDPRDLWQGEVETPPITIEIADH